MESRKRRGDDDGEIPPRSVQGTEQKRDDPVGLVELMRGEKYLGEYFPRDLSDMISRMVLSSSDAHTFYSIAINRISMIVQLSPPVGPSSFSTIIGVYRDKRCRQSWEEVQECFYHFLAQRIYEHGKWGIFGGLHGAFASSTHPGPSEDEYELMVEEIHRALPQTITHTFSPSIIFDLVNTRHDAFHRLAPSQKAPLMEYLKDLEKFTQPRSFLDSWVGCEARASEAANGPQVTINFLEFCVLGFSNGSATQFFGRNVTAPLPFTSVHAERVYPDS